MSPMDDENSKRAPMLKDLLLLIREGLQISLRENPAQLAWFLIGGVIAAVLFFFLCSWFTQLFNRKFKATLSHYVWCVVAALVTVLLSIGLVPVMNLGGGATEGAAVERAFASQSSPEYQRLWDHQEKALLAAGYQQPDAPRFHSAPDSRAKRVAIEDSCTEALKIFAEQNPVLDRLLQGGGERAVEEVVERCGEILRRAKGEHLSNRLRLPVNEPGNGRCLQPVHSRFSVQSHRFGHRPGSGCSGTAHPDGGRLGLLSNQYQRWRQRFPPPGRHDFPANLNPPYPP